jgi:hypothetical protein
VQPGRIAIFGASYGAYLVYCSLARDPLHRFACGVAKYGDINIQTSWAQVSRSVREDQERMMSTPSASREADRAGSPIWDVENIRKPLLIVHGLEDRTVHPYQSGEPALTEPARPTSTRPTPTKATASTGWPTSWTSIDGLRSSSTGTDVKAGQPRVVRYGDLTWPEVAELPRD